MKVKDLLETASCEVRLHDACTGVLVAKVRESLEKYREVEVVYIDCRLDFGHDHHFAKAYLFAYGSSFDIEDCKRGLYEQS